MKLGQKLDKMNVKERQNIKSWNYEPLWRYLGSNRQSMRKIFGWSWAKMNKSTEWFKLVTLNNLNNSIKLTKFDKLDRLDKFDKVHKFNKFDKFEFENFKVLKLRQWTWVHANS